MRIVICNTPPERAADIARTLVEESLAACVNINPEIRSFYVWDGAVCDDAESTLIIKVAEKRVDALRKRILELHPYDVPEVLVLPIDTEASHGPYVEWVRGQA